MLFLSVFYSRDEVFDKKRDHSDLAGIYSAYLSQQLSYSSKSKSFLGALIIEPGNQDTTIIKLFLRMILRIHFQLGFSLKEFTMV